MMKKIISLFLLIGISANTNILPNMPSLVPNAPSLELQVSCKQHEKSKLLLGMIGHWKDDVNDLAITIKKDLEFSGQFIVDLRTFDKLDAKHDVAQLHMQGYNVAIFLSSVDRGHNIEWRMYDTSLAEMLRGKKYHKRGKVVRGWGHNIADMLWNELTSQEGFFSTKIAYCKEVAGPKRRKLKHIFLADYDGGNEEPIVEKATISVAPRFNRGMDNPLLFYSESTNENLRLMVVNMHGVSKIASNYDGINMLPAFSFDGSQVVYCASQGHGNTNLYFYKKGSISPITASGNNISPTFAADGKRIFFCSDISGTPHIYCYNIVTGIQTQMTDGKEACFSPSYCDKTGQLAYAKLIKGTMQICLYDENSGAHKQITFDKENKDECCWSPCGNFLMFCAELGNKGRIAMLNVMTGDRRYLTAERDVCSYPTWSPVYGEYITVT